MSDWQPIETAPKDGQWIIGFTNQEELYVVMRWWDGTMHDQDDDLSGDEEGQWTGGDDVHRHLEYITHWCAFEPHPKAPPKTTSYGTFDAKYGAVSVPRSERGITERDILHRRTWYLFAEEMQDAGERVDFDNLSDFVDAYLDAQDELDRRVLAQPDECPQKLWEDILAERGIDHRGRPEVGVTDYTPPSNGNGK